MVKEALALFPLWTGLIWSRLNNIKSSSSHSQGTNENAFKLLSKNVTYSGQCVRQEG